MVAMHRLFPPTLLIRFRRRNCRKRSCAGIVCTGATHSFQMLTQPPSPRLSSTPSYPHVVFFHPSAASSFLSSFCASCFIEPADRMKGKPQMMTNSSKSKASTTDGYFSKKFDRPFEKEYVPSHKRNERTLYLAREIAFHASLSLNVIFRGHPCAAHSRVLNAKLSTS